MTQTERAVTKKVELVAWRFTGDDQLPDWVREHTVHVSSSGLTLQLGQDAEHDHQVRVPPGGWITKEVGGGLGACTHETFQQRYQMLSADTNSVHLAMQARMFQPTAWNDALVERACHAFHHDWAKATENDKAATRLQMRKALTAAISTGF